MSELHTTRKEVVEIDKEKEWIRRLIKQDNPSFDFVEENQEGDILVVRALERWRKGTSLGEMLLLVHKDIALGREEQWNGGRYGATDE